MKICIFGNKKSTKTLIHEINSHGFIVDTLVVLNNESASKIEISGYEIDLVETAREAEINVYFAKSYSLINDIDFFHENKFDIGLSAGWQRIIPRSVLDCFKYGVYGWHGSGFRFPNGRGRSPLNWSIRLGLKVIHHNCFKYDAIADSGEIFDTYTFKIDDNDYIQDVQIKALDHIKNSAISLLKCANLGAIPLERQVAHPHIIFPALKCDSGSLYPANMFISDALNIIRSCSYPFPGAFIRLYELNCLIRLWKAERVISSKILEALPVNYLVIISGVLFISFKDGLLCSEDYEKEIDPNSKIIEKIHYKCN